MLRVNLLRGKNFFYFAEAKGLFLFLMRVVLVLGESMTEKDTCLFMLLITQIHLFLNRYPIAVLDIIIIGSDGQIWLQSRTTGEGERQMFDLDISEENLRLALQNAIDELGSLEPNPRKRRGNFKKISYE